MRKLATIFAVWLVGIFPIGYFIWSSGPAKISDVRAIASTPEFVSAGEQKQFYLEGGLRGVWVTATNDFAFVNPNNVFTVTSPDGVEVLLSAPPGESILVVDGERETYISGVFRAQNPGFFSLAVDDEVPAGTEVRFGPVWSEGVALNPTNGLLGLALAWALTLGCAFVAFREVAKYRQEKLASTGLSAEKEPSPPK